MQTLTHNSRLEKTMGKSMPRKMSAEARKSAVKTLGSDHTPGDRPRDMTLCAGRLRITCDQDGHIEFLIGNLWHMVSDARNTNWTAADHGLFHINQLDQALRAHAEFGAAITEAIGEQARETRELDTWPSDSDQSLGERLASETERWASETERLKTTLANLLATELADVLPVEAPAQKLRALAALAAPSR
jgi:hypothetical protein